MRRAWAGAVWVVLAAGCGEAAFSAHARDNAVEDIAHILQTSRAPAAGPQNGTGKPMAFLVTTGSGADRQVVGFDLASGQTVWSEKTDVRSRVAVGRGLIIHRQGERDLVGRDPATGRLLFTVHLDGGEKFLGAAVDDQRWYYVVQATGAQRQSTTVGVDATGHELWRVPVAGSLASPAARGGVVAVPFAYQWMVFLDGATGKELARVRATDEQVTFVRALPDGFFYGGNHGVYLLDDKSAAGSRKDSTFLEANLGSDSIKTSYYMDGYQSSQVDYSAADRNRLLWRATITDKKLGFFDGLTVVQNYRYLFALDAGAGTLRWAYAHPRVDLVSAELGGRAILFASADGEVGAIDTQTGAVRLSQKTGLKLHGATFDADGFDGGAVSEKPDVLKVLEKIVWDHDARFNTVKGFAVASMGAVTSSDATRALLKIVLAPTGVPPAVQKRAGDELVARKDLQVTPQYIEALKVHDDFLEDKQAHGVDVLARALARTGTKEAAPALAAHLADPATPLGSLQEVAAALAALGGKDAQRALRAFLVTYRADPAFLADPAPLTVAADGLLAIGGPEERRLVEFVAADKRTLPPVARALQKSLTAPRASK